MEVSDPDLLDAALLAVTMFNNAGARLMAGHVPDPGATGPRTIHLGEGTLQ